MNKINLILILLLFVSAKSFSQTKTISGIVLDSVAGTPLNGAVIKIDSSHAVLTDRDGNFQLKIAASLNGASMEVNSIGYQTRYVFLDSQTNYTIKLVESSHQLNDVIVVGYGSVKKSDLTGSLASVSSKEIAKQPSTNLALSLQGKVPGAVIQSNNGNPGSSIKIRIRGANSITGNNDPLYVIDGVEGGSIDAINVNDVADVQILKDASATAIYGSRGANGVVLITTKHGANMPTEVQVIGNVSISKLPKKYDIVDAASYAQLINKIKGTDYFSASQIENYQQNGGTDWQGELFHTGITQNHELSFRGGSKSTTFFVSGNYINQRGIEVNTNNKVYNFRTNLTTSFLNKFKLYVNFTAFGTDGLNTNDIGGKGSPIWVGAIMSPTYSPNDSNRYDALSGTGQGNVNPALVMKNRYTRFQNNGWSVNARLNYKITNDLQLDVYGNSGISNNKTGIISNDFLNVTQTSASQQLTQNTGWQNTNILTYDKNFSQKHHLTVTAMEQQIYNDQPTFTASGTGIYPISLGYDNLGISSIPSVASGREERKLRSYLGRINYSFMDKYLLTLSYRADASSVFTEDHKWAYFPSAAFAWNISDEKFMQTQNFISKLKLRTSWGKTGNQGIGVNGNIGYYNNWNYSFGQTNGNPGTYLINASNPNLKWETTTQTNVGVDIGVLKNRINLTADFYVKNTKDLMLAVPIPGYDGGGTILQNIGQVRNKGYEVAIFGTAISQGSFQWDYNFNISSYKNKVVSLGDQTQIFGTNPADGEITASPFIIKVGEPLGSYYGYEWQGIYTTAQSAEAAKMGLKPGDNIYADLDGDNAITSSDEKVLGNSNPKFSLGFDNTFTYKNFSLDIMLQSVLGRKMLNVMYADASTIIPDAPNITTKDGFDYWTSDHENAKFANPFTSTGKNYLVSSEYLQNASYLKVKNVALSYMLHKNLIKFSDVKFSVSAQNLLTFTKYKGYDPEVSSYNKDSDGTLDYGAYPNPRTITFSLQLNF